MRALPEAGARLERVGEEGAVAPWQLLVWIEINLFGDMIYDDDI